MDVRKVAVCLAVVSLVATGTSRAERPTGNLLNVKTVRVIVFKDGYCMFVKEATGRVAGDRMATIAGVPEVMVLGSCWVVPEEGRLVSLVAHERSWKTHGQQNKEKSLLLEFEEGLAGKDVAVRMQYFGPGIRWIPTYLITLRDDAKAEMRMQAEILNEAEDLEGVPVDLVVGVPNFRFKNVVSPLSLQGRLRNALQQAAPELMGQRMSNVLLTQRAGEFRGRMPEPEAIPSPSVPAMPPELTGEGAQDLFVYHVPRLRLQTGERAAIPILSAQVPFNHLYAWDVHLRRSGAEALPGSGPHRSPVKLLKNEVWHLIELTNNTEVPWTTGAALTMDGYLPLGQELLTYTPVRGKCQLPLTVAVDVRGTFSEEEISRELKAIRHDGYDYVRISKKGTLRVTNYKKEAIHLIIACEFGGNATSASDNGKIILTDFVEADWANFRGHHALTGHSTIRWDLEVGAGQTEELACEYNYYTR